MNGSAGRSSAQFGNGAPADQDVLSALAGTQANRECEVAHRTRRVVLASLGVIREQKAGRSRVRSVALAAILLVVLLLGPLISWAIYDLLSGGRLCDPTSQFALWVCILCPAVAAAALVAGWMGRRF